MFSYEIAEPVAPHVHIIYVLFIFRKWSQQIMPNIKCIYQFIFENVQVHCTIQCDAEWFALLAGGDKRVTLCHCPLETRFNRCTQRVPSLYETHTHSGLGLSAPTSNAPTRWWWRQQRRQFCGRVQFRYEFNVRHLDSSPPSSSSSAVWFWL